MTRTRLNCLTFFKWVARPVCRLSSKLLNSGGKCIVTVLIGHFAIF